jgi:hypothetical protein
LVSADLANVQTIGEAAFSECHCLTKVLGLAVKHVNNKSFSKCGKLELVCLPKMSEIGLSAFEECHLLKQIVSRGSEAVLKEYALTCGIKYLCLNVKAI